MLQKRLKEEILVFDGAMGTQLQEAGLKAGDIPECLNITDPFESNLIATATTKKIGDNNIKSTTENKTSKTLLIYSEYILLTFFLAKSKPK